MQNWGGNYTFAAARLHRPTSLSEAQRLVASSPRIRAIGTRHSFSGIADSPGDLIDLSGIAPDITIDRERMTVTVGAGASYSALVFGLQREGFALHNLASLPHISVAGAVSTATHGSGDHNQALSSAVAGFDLIAGDGALQRIARGDEDFPGMVVGLGAFGVMSRITLDICASYDVRQDSFIELPWDDLVAGFDAISSAAYSFSIFTKWSGPTADRLWLKTRLSASHSDALDIAHLRLRPGPPYAVPTTVPDPLARLNPFDGVPGPWSERLAHFRHDSVPGVEVQSEYLIARSQLPAAIAILRSMAARIDPLLHAAEIRTMAADELWLSPAYQRDSVGIHFSWKRHSDDVEVVTRELEAALLPLGARPHWGKVIHADATALSPLYPRMSDFRRCAGLYDPSGKFRNAFLERHIFGAHTAPAN